MLFKIDKNLNQNINLFGGKANSLIRLFASGITIPKGFVISTTAFDTYLKLNCITDADIDELQKNPNSKKNIRKFKTLKNAKIPESIRLDIKKLMSQMQMSNKTLVIRSSANIEDSKSLSFAGQFKTVIAVKLKTNLFDAIREVYLSTFELKVINYCTKKCIKLKHIKLAIIIQELIEGECSGVMFTKDPFDEGNKILIETILGLNQALVSGLVTPSRYIVSKNGLVIDRKEIIQKKLMKVKDSKLKVLNNNQNLKAHLNNDAICRLVKYGKTIERLFGAPQDIEWTIVGGKIYFLQSRPITTNYKKSDAHVAISYRNSINVLTGYPASAGFAEGEVFIAANPKEKAPKDRICVFSYTNTDFIPIMKNARGLITEEGGILSHAAIVAREFGIPAVVGIDGIMKQLSNGDQIKLDGEAGKVYLKNSHNIKSNVESKIEGKYYDEADFYCFDKMKQIRFKRKILFYEVFSKRVVYYSKNKVSIPELKKLFRKFYVDKIRIDKGNEIKFLIKIGFYTYYKDQKLHELLTQTLSDLDTFNSKAMLKIFPRIIKFSKIEMKLLDKKFESKYLTDLHKFLVFRRVDRAFMLLDTLVCEGYGIRVIFRKTHKILKKMNISFPMLLARAETWSKDFSLNKLNKDERTTVETAIDYYNIIKNWKQIAYPCFVSMGMQGKRFSKQYESSINKLNNCYGSKETLEWVNIALDKLPTQQ